MLRKFFIVALFTLLSAGCATHQRISKTETKSYRLESASNSAVDSAAYFSILPYQKTLQAEMGIVLAVSEQPLEKAQPEGLLGDFVADACLSVTKQFYHPSDQIPADFIFLNNGGLRSSLPKGNITKGNIFELMPFENELVVLKLNAVLVKKVFNFIAEKDGVPIAGARFELKNKEAVNIFINNQPFDTTRIYKVITSDYLANGGDQLFFLAEVKERDPVNLKVRDAILQYLEQKTKANEHLVVKKDQRISYAE